MAKLNIKGAEITIITVNDYDFISLTDMANSKGNDSRAADIIKNWLRNRYTPAVYNNFPFPVNSSEKQTKAIETAAQKVLDTRLEFPNSSLADLYDPLTMPPALVKAHNELDKAVDLAYRPQPFTSEANRMVFLFELYEKYTADLFTEVKTKKPRKTKE